MLSKQILKKHWINNIFLLIGIFLLLSFFLPFTAEGGALTIQDCTCSGAGKTVTFDVNITRSSGSFGEFGFNVKYDSDILEYMNENRGDLAEHITVIEHGDYLEIQGRGNIDGEETGRLVRLNFIVKKCEESTLELTNPVGDFWRWSTSNGSLIKTKNEISGYGMPWGYSTYGSPYNYYWNQPYGYSYWNGAFTSGTWNVPSPSYYSNPFTSGTWSIPSAPYGYGTYSYYGDSWPDDPFTQRGFNPAWAVDPYLWLVAH